MRSFPLETAAQFQADPIVLGSIDLKRDHLMRFTTLNELCYPDDLLDPLHRRLGGMGAEAARGGRDARLGPLPHDAGGRLAGPDRRVAAPAPHPLRRHHAGAVARVGPDAGATGGEPSGARGEWNVEELSKKAKAVSGQVVDQIDQVSERMARGFLKFKDKALKKYRDKFGPDKKK